ncbi:hypothetical protein REPUB_Repub07fG0148000 [Reevesia pubescens]
MDRQHGREQAKITASRENEEVSSIKWEFIKMTEEEEDLIYRMHRLVGDGWDLIAGRIPGRKAEEIERFWVMKDLPKEEKSTMEKSSKRNWSFAFNGYK